METLLSIQGLKTYFYTDDGVVKAVDDVSIEIGKGECLGLVGESGCGKSVTSLSIMRLIPTPPGKIEAGTISFNGKNLLELDEKSMRKIRGNDISMIFQEPMTSLNPVFTIGNQIGEAIELHQQKKGKALEEEAVKALKAVSIPDPYQRLTEYPHQLSGGMRQRVMIAMALSCRPSLLIADEPTTALDVTIQAQILELLKSLQDRFSLSMLLITHDLGVVAETAHRIAVMYAGHIVEESTTYNIFKNTKHPYTQGLLKSIPRIDRSNIHKEKLATIKGVVPELTNLPQGCRFQDRCPHVRDECRQGLLPLKQISDDHKVRCVLYY